jgi:beta-lactamase class A
MLNFGPMKQSSRINWLGIFSGLCLLGAVVLLVLEMVLFSRSFSAMPAGVTLGGVPVGGLTEQQALEQLVLVYNSPVELRYGDELILLEPASVNFQVDANLMIPEVNQYRSNEGFWQSFWDFLWLKPAPVIDVPLRSAYSRERLEAVLADIAARYDRPGSAPRADPDTLGFVPGETGHALEVEDALAAIDAKLKSPTDRTVVLPLTEQTAVRPSFDTLAELVQTDVDLFQFDGVLSLYLMDLSTGRELVLNIANGEPIDGPAAYSGMSTIKIPVMATYFINNGPEITPDEHLLLSRSMEESQNTATDMLLKIIGAGDGYNGTRQLTADMQRLGLHNTYLSGLLDIFGAVLLPIATPANSRADLNLNPDPYNQTTAEDMGSLMVMIYQCSQGGGALIAAFPGRVTAEECRAMIDYMTQNQVGPIFVAGGSSPDGVVAHKHGWDLLPLNNVGDAALVFTPSANYALTIFVHSDEPMTFDEANRLVISISRAVYNYFNWESAS